MTPEHLHRGANTCFSLSSCVSAVLLLFQYNAVRSISQVFSGTGPQRHVTVRTGSAVRGSPVLVNRETSERVTQTKTPSKGKPHLQASSGVWLKTCAVIWWWQLVLVQPKEKRQVSGTMERVVTGCLNVKTQLIPAGGHRVRNEWLQRGDTREFRRATGRWIDRADCDFATETARDGRAEGRAQRCPRAEVVQQQDESVVFSSVLLPAIERVLHIAARVGNKCVGHQCELGERRP